MDDYTVSITAYFATREEAERGMSNAEEAIAKANGSIELNEIEGPDSDYYPPCPICSEPIDYCLGHGDRNSEDA